MRLFRQRSPEDDLADRQRKLADLFVRTARDMARVRFDYSEDSVALLDEWADNLWDPAEPPPPYEAMETSATTMGSYFGEVIIRHLGGRWVWSDDAQQPGVEVGDGLALVLARAFTRQIDGPDKSFLDYYSALKQRVAGAFKLTTPRPGDLTAVLRRTYPAQSRLTLSRYQE